MSHSILLSCALLCAQTGGAESPWRQYASPEEAGWSGELLAEAWSFADEIDSAAVFVVFRGHALLAWGDVERRFECHSVRKSLMNALLGRAVESGALDTETSLLELGIDDLQPLSAEERGARVIDLLGARSGVYHPAAKEPADMRASRPARGSHRPGEFFFYNNWDFNVLGTIFERATGKGVFQAFREWFAAPLGMEDFRLQDGFAQLEPTRSRFPAHAFRLSARDLARFGQLYLERDAREGRALLSAAWIEESTRPHTDLGGGRGYGLLWWTYAAGSLGSYPHLDPHDHFAAIGTGGQLVLVVPGAELVFVHRGDTDHGREVRGERIWALVERVLAARVGAPAAEPALAELRVEPFPDAALPLPERSARLLDPAALAGLAGDYELPGMSVRIFVHEGRLFAQRSDGEEAELLPESESRFFLWMNAFEVEFARDEHGRAQRLVLRTPQGTLEGERAGARPAPGGK